MPGFGRQRYSDRRQAGRRLAEELGDLAGTRPVVLGLARGGVPVAAEVATALGAELDVLVVRKLGAPGNPEFAFGALAEGGGPYLNQPTVHSLAISDAELAAAIAHAEEQIAARVERFRSGRPLELADRVVLVVDDGLATGATARAALRAVRAQHPARLVLAVPVGAPETVEALAAEADEIICPLQPFDMWAVGAWYEHFGQVSDEEVVACLSGAPAADPPRGLRP